MLRRFYLKSMIGTMLVFGGAHHAIFESARAAEPVGAKKANPSSAPNTVDAALRSGRSDSAVSFILLHPDTAAAASTMDKASLLRLVADRECSQLVRPDRERAALILLKPVATQATELAAIAQGFGGAAPIQALIPGIQSKELYTILTNAARLVQS
jgi:hypothetical protein